MTSSGISRRRVLSGATVPAVGMAAGPVKAVGLVGAGLLAACGVQPATPTTSAQPPSATAKAKVPVTLSYISATGVERQQVEKELFADIKRELPHITIEGTGAGSWPDTKAKFLVSAAGGTPISFVQGAWETWLDTWNAGAVVDITSFSKRDKVDLEDTFLEPALAQWTHEGMLGGMPATMSVDAMAYNVDLFEQAGLRQPSADTTAAWWTMETFLDYAKKLTDRSRGLIGFGGTMGGANFGGTTAGTFFGQGPWDDAAKKCLMETPTFQKGLQFWKELGTAHRVQPEGEEIAQLKGQTGDVFFSGKVGMQVVFAQTPLPFKWAMASLPYSGTAGTKNVSGRINTHGLQMGKARVEEQEGAWEVYRWLMKPENGGRFPLSAGHVVSPLKAPAASEISQKRYREKVGIDPKVFLLQAQTTRPYGWGMGKYANFARLRNEIDERYQKEFLADKLGLRDYAAWVTKYVDDNLGAK